MDSETAYQILADQGGYDDLTLDYLQQCFEETRFDQVIDVNEDN